MEEPILENLDSPETEEVTTDTTEQGQDKSDSTTDKATTNKTQQYIDSLKSKVNEYATKAEQVQKEKEEEIQRVKVETEKKYAIDFYGEEVVNDPKVVDLKTKYPDMSYTDVFKLADISQPVRSSWGGRPAWSLSSYIEKPRMSTQELADLSIKDPSSFREAINKMHSWELEVVPA